MKKWKGLLLMLAIIWSILMQPGTQVVEAASKNIRIDEFVEYIVKQMEWQIDEESERPYIEVAMKKGILKKGEFKDYTAYLTRTDAAVIADRLDESINLKYGYTDDVYEFLSGCKLFEGKLFYSTEGSLYPKGATRKTYPEERFHEDVVEAVLMGVYKGDKNIKESLRTGYYYIYDDDGNIIERYLEIGLVPINKETFDIDSFDEKSEVIQAWNRIKDSDRKASFVLNKRISDINNIPKSKREAVANIVAKGIIKGYSNGMYVQNREFRGNNIITNKGAKDVIQKVINPDLRALISPDGQLIRTRKLPKNADEYAYILECFPNEYYESKYRFMTLTDYELGILKKEEYCFPIEVNYKYFYDRYYNYQMELGMDKYEYYDSMLCKLEKYLQFLFNVDYRKVDDTWKENLASTFDQYMQDWRIERWIDRYIEKMKENSVIVECREIAFNPDTIYENRKHIYIKVYVKYRITADNVDVESNELLYGEYNSLSNMENGEWRDGIYDIELTSTYTRGQYQWGVASNNIIYD